MFFPTIHVNFFFLDLNFLYYFEIYLVYGLNIRLMRFNFQIFCLISLCCNKTFVNENSVVNKTIDNEIETLNVSNSKSF